jgi:argininosuccinate lyase
MKEVFGRLSKPPHSELHRLVYAPGLEADTHDQLPVLLHVNAAHVAMLENCNILDTSTAAALLRVNEELAAAVAKGEQPLGKPESHRGLYALFEHELIARLGEIIGGAAHVARSRNDINATITRVRVRGEILSLVDDLLKMQESLIAQAVKHGEALMCGYTHLQPAQPTTFAHYLLAIAAENDRSADRLLAAHDRLNHCPMGACAGFGTSFAIRPDLIAGFLGFTGPLPNSLDAVASRDFVIDVLSSLAIIGTTLTRLALDLQLWSANSYQFISWPDDLVSTSSIMPQKRNAFVLEVVRGKAVTPSGELVAAITGLKNTPFTNSVEVSSEVSARVYPAATDISTALQLMALLIENVEVNHAAMLKAVLAEDLTATALVDFIVQRARLPFRLAHEAVAELVASQAGPAQPERLIARLDQVLESHTGHPIHLDREDVVVSIDPARTLLNMASGGGPARSSVEMQLVAQRARVVDQRRRIERIRLQERAADDRLRAEISRIIGTEQEGGIDAGR